MLNMREKSNVRRSGVKIMASLIVLLGSLSYIMILAVINGSVGFLCAMGVTLFGAVEIAKALGETIALSYAFIVGLAILVAYFEVFFDILNSIPTTTLHFVCWQCFAIKYFLLCACCVRQSLKASRKALL